MWLIVDSCKEKPTPRFWARSINASSDISQSASQGTEGENQPRTRWRGRTCQIGGPCCRSGWTLVKRSFPVRAFFGVGQSAEVEADFAKPTLAKPTLAKVGHTTKTLTLAKVGLAKLGSKKGWPKSDWPKSVWPKSAMTSAECSGVHPNPSGTRMESEMEENFGMHSSKVVREHVVGARVANSCRRHNTLWGWCDEGLCSRVVSMVLRCSFDWLTSRFSSLSKKKKSLSDEGWTEEKIIKEYDALALEDHSYEAAPARRTTSKELENHFQSKESAIWLSWSEARVSPTVQRTCWWKCRRRKWVNPVMTDFGQSNFGQNWCFVFWPFSANDILPILFVMCCFVLLCCCVFSPPNADPPSAGPPLFRTPFRTETCHTVEPHNEKWFRHFVILFRWLYSAMDLCFLGCLPDAAQLLVPFRKIAEDSGGSTSCDTQPNCRTLFTIATALLSPPFLVISFSCPSSAELGTLCRIYSAIQTYRIDIREDTNGHKVIWSKSRSFCTAVGWTS